MLLCRFCKGSGRFLLYASPYETQLCPRCLGDGCEGENKGPKKWFNPKKIPRKYPKGINKDLWDRLSDRVNKYRESLRKSHCPYLIEKD